MLICENSNCAAVETGESLKIQQCSKPQPTITFLLTQTFQYQLRNPGSVEERKDPSLTFRMTAGFVVMLSAAKHLFFSVLIRER